MNTQIPLNIQLPEGISFSNFYVGSNQELVHSLLQSIAGDENRLIYLWGLHGVGKTHLLQAACHEVSEQGKPTAYIPLAQHEEFSVEILQGLETTSLVCFDDLDKVAGNKEWEEALFHAFNVLRDLQVTLLISAAQRPADCGFQLPDLISRLNWGLVQHVNALDDEQKIEALILRASIRGFDLPKEVGRYLLTRLPRDMQALFAVLDQLDEASLVQQRKLTIPFVKGLIDL